MNPLEVARAELKKAQEARDALYAQVQTLLQGPTAENRGLNEDEIAKFNDAEAQARSAAADVVTKEALVKSLELVEARRANAANAMDDLRTGDDQNLGGAVVKSEPRTYDRWGQHSYMRDIAAIGVPGANLGDPVAAQQRIYRHAEEVEVEARTNERVRNQLEHAKRDMKSNRGRGEFEERVNPNTTFGTGGEFVPPLWLENEYVPFMRPGRTFANRVTNRPLPPGVDQINIPKITVGTKTGVQSQQGGAVASQDLQTGSVSTGITTIAGQEDVSIQLLEQSPLAIDDVIFTDLQADYDQQLDLQVLVGNGSAGANGQLRGIFTVPSQASNTSQQFASRVTVASPLFFDASTSGTQYRSILNGKNQVETLRFRSPTAIWVAPRRANSWEYAADSTGRPLFIKNTYGVFQQLGIDVPNPVAEGLAGEMAGLPVWKDPNMPQTANSFATTGGTADIIAVLKEDDILLWEGTQRLRALPEVLSGTLQVRFQLYAYSGLIPDRLPASISFLAGNTGLAAPTF